MDVHRGDAGGAGARGHGAQPHVDHDLDRAQEGDEGRGGQPAARGEPRGRAEEDGEHDEGHRARGLAAPQAVRGRRPAEREEQRDTGTRRAHPADPCRRHGDKGSDGEPVLSGEPGH